MLMSVAKTEETERVSMRPEHFHSGNRPAMEVLMDEIDRCFNEAGAFSLR